MKRRLLCLFLLALLAGAQPVLAQSAPPPDPTKGTYLGVLFGPLDTAARAKLPLLHRDSGVLITHVLPDSPAALVGLRRDDVLLAYDQKPIRDSQGLVELIQASKPNQVVALKVLREGRTFDRDVTLSVGTILRLAKPAASDNTPGVGKANGPSPLTVTAVPMEKNRLKVTFEFPNAGRIQVVDCEGDVAEIDRQIRELPPKVQNLALAALRRLRELDLQKGSTVPGPRER